MKTRRQLLTEAAAVATWSMSTGRDLFARPRDVPDHAAYAWLGGATEWLNAPALSAANLIGKVVLVEFWTYSCINWRRQYPYVRAWAGEYEDLGLVVIGVHTPEFDFEKHLPNVRRAVRDGDVRNPVAIDSQGHIWTAFGNSAWPALYFMDAKGKVRHRHDGEGDYETSERMLQRLLTEAGAHVDGRGLVEPAPVGAEAQADWPNLRSFETYLGYERARNLGPSPRDLRLNQWAMAGRWSSKAQAVTLQAANGSLSYRFHARDLHVVMGATRAPVPFRVSIDGQPPGSAHGLDADALGHGTVATHRMYQLIRQSTPIVDRHFEIEFMGSDVEVFLFSFG